MDLKDKVAVITGASGAIGAACAHQMAAAGAKIRRRSRRRPGPLAGPGTRSSRTGDSEEFRVGRIQVRPTQAEWRVRAQGLGA